MHLFNNREQKYISIEGAEINKCEEEANKFAKYSLISKDLWLSLIHICAPSTVETTTPSLE